MNDILMTGNTKFITDFMLNEIDEGRKIVICGETAVKNKENQRVTIYPFCENDKEYRGIFQSFNFDMVVYLSKVLDGQKRLYDELENLENALYSAVLSGIKHFIYLTTNDYVNQEMTTRTRLLRTCDDICKQFVDENDISVLILRVPYIYSMAETDCKIVNTIKSAKSKGTIYIDGGREQLIDFINDEDLGRLICRICEEPMTGFHIVDVSGGNEVSCENAGQFISDMMGISKIQYMGYKEAVPSVTRSDIMRINYGWFPKHRLKDDIEELLKVIKKDETHARRAALKNNRWKRIKKILLISIEMVFVFVLSEILNIWMGEKYRLGYVDFRVLFVIIMGLSHGTGAGIAASVCSCIAYLAKNMSDRNWQIIFYNIENWFPFVAYFLTGMVVGHVKDKYEEMLNFKKEEHAVLERKYNFLTELYTKILENKEEFSHQIISYEDSFGKLYQVVRKLNSTVQDQIFYEAIFAIEEILETKSVAIYTIGASKRYARLNVCSRMLTEKISKSIDLSNYDMLMKAFEQKQNWYNAEGYKDYPAYASPVWKEGSLCGAIIIWNASAAQMKMDYYNKFSILSGLVQDALVRAIEYGEQKISSQMIGNTKILQPEYFEEILSIREKIGNEGLSDYMLLEVEAPELSLEQLGESITCVIRNNDIVGMRKDQKVYLLLSQINDTNWQGVKERLEAVGIRLIRK